MDPAKSRGTFVTPCPSTKATCLEFLEKRCPLGFVARGSLDLPSSWEKAQYWHLYSSTRTALSHRFGKVKSTH
jgi:hypothetical protein